MEWKRGHEYPQAVRDRILEMGGPVRDIARELGVSSSYVGRVMSRMRLSGERSARRRGGQRKAVLAGREDLLRARAAATPDATLMELKAWLLETHGVRISIGALWASLRRIGVSRPSRRRHRSRPVPSEAHVST